MKAEQIASDNAYFPMDKVKCVKQIKEYARLMIEKDRESIIEIHDIPHVRDMPIQLD